MISREMDVVIISYSKNDTCKKLTETTLNTLYESEDSIKFNVFVVESQENVSWESYEKPGFKIKTIRPESPYGYHKYLNLGRKQGSAEFVALCNNDLVFHKKWATKIFQASELNPSYLSFCPLCPRTQPLYGIKENQGFIKGYSIRAHVSGWCIVQKRSIYDIIGDLDEQFLHWYCDNDYAETLKAKKVNHMLVTSSIVEHHDQIVGKTTSEVIEDRKRLEELTYNSQIIFKNKWSI